MHIKGNYKYHFPIKEKLWVFKAQSQGRRQQLLPYRDFHMNLLTNDASVRGL